MCGGVCVSCACVCDSQQLALVRSLFSLSFSSTFLSATFQPLKTLLYVRCNKSRVTTSTSCDGHGGSVVVRYGFAGLAGEGWFQLRSRWVGTNRPTNARSRSCRFLSVLKLEFLDGSCARLKVEIIKTRQQGFLV